MKEITYLNKKHDIVSKDEAEIIVVSDENTETWYTAKTKNKNGRGMNMRDLMQKFLDGIKEREEKGNSEEFDFWGDLILNLDPKKLKIIQEEIRKRLG